MTLSIRHGAAALRCGARPAAPRGGPDQRRCRRDHRPGVPALPRRGSGVLPGVRPGRGWLGPLARARGLPAEHARGHDGARDQRAGGVAITGGERGAHGAAVRSEHAPQDLVPGRGGAGLAGGAPVLRARGRAAHRISRRDRGRDRLLNQAETASSPRIRFECGTGKMKRTPHRFASGFSSSFGGASIGPEDAIIPPLDTDVGWFGGAECPRCARNASTSRTVSRGRQATSRLLRSATARRVTAAADRAGSSCGPARRLALVPRTECAALGPDATSYLSTIRSGSANPCAVRVEPDTVAQHRAGDVQQSVGHRSAGRGRGRGRGCATTGTCHG